jgi:hypothetical protein
MTLIMRIQLGRTYIFLTVGLKTLKQKTCHHVKADGSAVKLLAILFMLCKQLKALLDVGLIKVNY